MNSIFGEKKQKKDSVAIDDSAFNLDFLNNDLGQCGNSDRKSQGCYKVVIADDEEEVHKMTKIVLKGFEFENTKLIFFDTYSGAETIKLLEKESDIAVILLDVVMEEDDSGLKVVKYLRDVLKNSFTRIVLRTGQPGKAPEESVVVDYEINEYKYKTELSVQKLYSTMCVSLRAYKGIRMLNKHKQGLEQVIKASRELFRYSSFTEFLNGLLMQINSLCDINSDSMYINWENHNLEGLALIKEKRRHSVVAATGKFKEYIGKPVDINNYPVDIDGIYRQIEENDKDEFMILKDNQLIVYNQNDANEITSCIIIEGDIGKTNLDFIKVFLTNFSLAIDNFLLNMKMNDTQYEIIYRFGEIVENRSSSTGSHVRRVAEITRFLSARLGYSEHDANSMALASIMHDVGKMAIPDNILLKPGRLTDEEYQEMKGHTIIGYNLFKDSKMELLEMAADIALNHHERYDGKGYPSGKPGGEISKVSEIVAVADVFDALVSKRCYKDAWPMEKVIEYFKENSGTQFAPDIVQHLLEDPDEIVMIMQRFPD